MLRICIQISFKRTKLYFKDIIMMLPLPMYGKNIIRA